MLRIPAHYRLELEGYSISADFLQAHRLKRRKRLVRETNKLDSPAPRQQNLRSLQPAKPALPCASDCCTRVRFLQSPLAGGPLPLAGSSSRSDRDSNSGYAFGVYTLSRRASSATRASLHIYLMPVLRAWALVSEPHCGPLTGFISAKLTLFAQIAILLQIFLLILYCFLCICLLCAHDAASTALPLAPVKTL